MRARNRRWRCLALHVNASCVDRIIECAARVISQATREKPADAILRDELKESRLSRADGRRAAELVFAFYRWRGLVKQGALPEQLEDARQLADRFAKDRSHFSTEELTQSVPEWASAEIPLAREWLESLQTPPAVWLRARLGQGADLANQLGDSSPAQGILSDAVLYRGKEDLFRSPEFQAGLFEIQDIGSQIVGLLCSPEPGETWWDACAGEGGKLLHLSDLMRNKGLIWATDRAGWRLKRLKQRAARAQAFNYRAAEWDGSAKLPTRTMFDGVLVDAPCSGLGTWQRNPHARWTTSLEDVQELGAIQKQLMVNTAKAVKPGGKLIYAVCTLTRTETDAVADYCSQQLSGFEPLPLPALPNEQPEASARKFVWPQHVGGNGMFVAAWRRMR